MREEMRVWLAVAASGLGSLGSVIASLDSHAEFVPFYAGLALLATIGAAVAHEPFVGTRRLVARVAAAVWVVAAAWVGVLLVMANTVWQAASPPPRPEQSFLGIPATAYYVAALYGGTALMALAVALPGGRSQARSTRSPLHGVPELDARDPA